MREHSFYQQLGLRPRVEHGWRDGEVEAPEPALTGDPADWLTKRPTINGALNRSPGICGNAALWLSQQGQRWCGGGDSE